MANLQDTLIETIERDFKEIQILEDTKTQRKEFNILMKRIEAAKNLLESNEKLSKKLLLIENLVQAKK